MKGFLNVIKAGKLVLFYQNLNKNQWSRVGFCMHVITSVYTILESFSGIQSKLIIIINLISSFG